MRRGAALESGVDSKALARFQWSQRVQLPVIDDVYGPECTLSCHSSNTRSASAAVIHSSGVILVPAGGLVLHQQAAWRATLCQRRGMCRRGSL